MSAPIKYFAVFGQVAEMLCLTLIPDYFALRPKK